MTTGVRLLRNIALIVVLLVITPFDNVYMPYIVVTLLHFISIIVIKLP